MVLHRSPIFDFHRGNLLLGCERTLLMLLGMLCMVLAILQTTLTIILAVLLWFCGLPLLKLMGKADPHMTRVFCRYRQYAEFYPAHSRKNYANRE